MEPVAQRPCVRRQLELDPRHGATVEPPLAGRGEAGAQLPGAGRVHRGDVEGRPLAVVADQERLPVCQAAIEVDHGTAALGAPSGLDDEAGDAHPTFLPRRDVPRSEKTSPNTG